METKVEVLEGNKVKVTVTVDAAAVDARIKKTYKDFAQKYNFPGFRKGKAPRPVIDNALGAEYVLATVSEDVINTAYPQSVEAEKLFPVGNPEFGNAGLVEAGKDFTFDFTVSVKPEIDINTAYPQSVEAEKLFPVGNPEFGNAGLVEAGKDFTFDFTVSVKPEIELTSYDAVEIELPVAGCSEAEISEQIEQLREHYQTFEDASAATKFKTENHAELAIKATDEDGETIEPLESESRLYAPGAGMMNEAFDAEVLGMKKGQTKEFSLDIAEDGETIEPLESESRLYAPGAGMMNEAFDAEVLGMKKGQTKEFSLDIAEDESAVLLSAYAGKKINFEVTCVVVKKQTRARRSTSRSPASL